MSKKNQITPATETTPAVFNMTAEDFNGAKGETFGGGANVLKIAPNSFAGPFTIAEIRKGVKLSKAVKGKVDVYVATDSAGTSWNLPASVSFVEKCKTAALKVGDVVAIARGADYKSKFGKENCASYALKVLSRAE